MTSPSLPNSVNHIFVDFENVQAIDLTGFGDHVVNVTLFVGAKQKRIDTTLVEQLVAHAERIHLVRLTSSGKNALDFTLAYDLGRAVCGDPTGTFHVVSKDTGFDPLIEHLNRQQTKVARYDKFADAIARIVGPSRSSRLPEKVKTAVILPPTLPKAVSGSPATISVEDVWQYLQRKDAHRARTRSKLRASLRNHFRLPEPELDRIISQLEGRYIDIDPKDKVTYRL